MGSWASSIICVTAGNLMISTLQAEPVKVGAFDLDGDGRITRTEFVKGRAARFAAYDHNGDQVISSADFPKGSQALILGTRVDKVIASTDLNHDGKITRLELGLSGSPLFDRADVDGNGIVERQEIARFRAQISAADGTSRKP